MSLFNRRLGLLKITAHLNITYVYRGTRLALSHLSEVMVKSNQIRKIPFSNMTELKELIISNTFPYFPEDHLLITNLRPATTYTVVVEARKMEKYKDVDEGTYKPLYNTALLYNMLLDTTQF